MKKLTLSKLRKKAWTLYSLKRRTEEKDFQDMVQCFTCPARVHYKEANLGHFKHNKLDFDPRNTRIQCVTCNLYKSGRLDVYAVRLIEENGLEWVKKLEQDAARFIGYKRSELDEIINNLKQ